MDQCDDVRFKIADLMNDFPSIKMKRNTFQFLRFIGSGNWNKRRNYERQNEFPTSYTKRLKVCQMTGDCSTPNITSTLLYTDFGRFGRFLTRKKKAHLIPHRFWAWVLFPPLPTDFSVKLWCR